VLTPDEHGVMVVEEAPPPGRYVLCDLPGGYHKFEVTEAGVPEVVIDLSRFGRVSGVVSVPCRVHIGPESGRTNPDGRYQIDYLPPGETQVEIRIGKAILHRPSLAIPEHGDVRLDIELRGVTVRGRLRHDGDSGSGSVSLRRRGRVAYQAWIDEEGRFEIPFVEPGQYEIRGHSSGDTQGEGRQITVGMQDADVGDVEVASGVDVEVVVTAPAGVLLAGRHDLHAFDGRDHRFAVLYLDENGRGRISLPAGKWRLSVHVGDLPQSDVDVEIPAREPVRFHLAR
jgi:hypothetical protein